MQSVNLDKFVVDLTPKSERFVGLFVEYLLSNVKLKCTHNFSFVCVFKDICIGNPIHIIHMPFVQLVEPF